MNIQETIEKYELKKGSHSSIEAGACVMELVSYLAKEPWSDRPKCACPALTSYAICLNDRMRDDDRQKLKRVIPKLLNSRDEKKKTARVNFLVLQSITVFLPILTEALELPEITSKLRSFKIGEWIETKKFINDSRPAIRGAAGRHPSAYTATAADAAYTAAYTAYTAYTAAADAAYTATAAYTAYTAYTAAYTTYTAAAYTATAAYTAYTAYTAAADAAYTAAYDAKNKVFWTAIKNKTVEAAITALEQACDL